MDNEDYESDNLFEGTQQTLPIAELISIVLTEDSEFAMDQITAWEQVMLLQEPNMREVLNAVGTLCKNENFDKRAWGVKILGRPGLLSAIFPEECFQILASLLQSESNADVLFGIACALGILRDKRASNLLVKLARHPDAAVRNGAVIGLYSYNDSEAVKALIVLTSRP